MSTRERILAGKQGLERVNLLTGRRFTIFWHDIAEVKFWGYGEDEDDMDFCNHVEFKGKGRHRIHVSDHLSGGLDAFLRNAASSLTGPQRNEMEKIQERIVKHRIKKNGFMAADF